MSDFAPNPDAAFAFQSMFNDRAEVSPLGCAGTSHFGFVRGLHPDGANPGWHVTTQIGGLNQGLPIGHHDFVNDFKF